MSVDEFEPKKKSNHDPKRDFVGLSDQLIRKFTRLTDVIEKILTLLELFKYQAKKLELLGSCDHELASLCFKMALRLFSSSQKLPAMKYGALLKEVSNTLQRLYPTEAKVEESLVANCSASSDVQSRFTRLKGSSPGKRKFDISQQSCDFVSPSDLNHYLRSSPQLVLLVDFRSRKEYMYSHINFANVVNIEPKVVADLFSKTHAPTDQDLECLLKKVMSPNELVLFRKRHEFDWVVLYNLKYGVFCDDKYESLAAFIQGDFNSFLLDSPFSQVIDLLMYRNALLSTRLKNYPLFLNGGLQRWFGLYGEASLTRGQALLLEPDRRKTEANEPLENAKSSYLRSFQDYMENGSGKANVQSKGTQRLGRRENQFVVSTQGGYNSNRSAGQNMMVSNPSELDIGQEVLRNLRASFSFSTGLANLGNSCYMNCILQCLAATPQLSSFLLPTLSHVEGSDGDSYKGHINMENPLGLQGIITVSFVELLIDMSRNKGKSIAPTKFKKVAGSLSPGRQFATTEQQDCIEFLNFMLDSIHEDLNQRLARSLEERMAIMELSAGQEFVRENLPIRLASAIEWERYLKLNFSIIVDYFQGQYVSQLRCLECQMTSSTFNSFTILSLPIPRILGPTKSRALLLFDCLDSFVETELLDDDNKWHCPRCLKFCKLTKKLVISRLPKILIIHFKRFEIQNGRFRKLDNFIRYPVNDVLDLTRYWPPVGTYMNQSKEMLSETKERELLSNLPERYQIPPFRYELYGVVNHYGNLTTGHYTSFVKNSDPRNDWSYYDDAKVLQNCPENRVLNQNAYCLFYKRC